MDVRETETQARSRRRSWIILPLFVALIVCSYLFNALNNRDDNVNNENYRILHEASLQLENNFEKLRRAYKQGQSDVAIRALFSSYQSEVSGLDKKSAEIKFSLSSTDITIFSDDSKIAEVKAYEILPNPSFGFSKFLFVDELGRVVAQTGGEKKLAFNNLEKVASAFSPEYRSFFSKLGTTKTSKSSSSSGTKLPSHSSHVDIRLAHGNYRVYTYPFEIASDIKLTKKSGESNLNGNALYLVGFVAKHELNKHTASKWNVPIVVISAVMLLVLLAVARLYLRPKNEFSTHLYRFYALAVCNLAFIAILALIFSGLEAKKFTNLKTEYIYRYINDLSKKVNEEVVEKFITLEVYQEFFQEYVNQTSWYDANGHSSVDGELREAFKRQGISGDSQLLFYSATSNEVSVSNCPNVWDGANQCAINRQPSSNEKKTHLGKVRQSTASKLYLLDDIDSSFDGLPCYLNRYCSPLDYQDWIQSHRVNELTVNLKGNQSKEIDSFSIINPALELVISDDKHHFKAYARPASGEEALISLPQGFLNTVLVNKSGFAASPAIFFREPSSKPRANSLAHREYFKRIRDQQGWTIQGKKLNEIEKKAGKQLAKGTSTSESEVLKLKVFENVYIQRLRNIADSTTGTTISMQLNADINGSQTKDKEEGGSQGANESVKDDGSNYVLISDVYFDSIATFNLQAFFSEASQSKVQEGHEGENNKELSKTNDRAQKYRNVIAADLTYMLVHRDSGEVLFHSESSRSLMENIFYSGNAKQGLNEWIKSAGQTPRDKPVKLRGSYHGKEGNFYLKALAVDEWALIVFSPDAMEVWFVANQFIFYFVAGFLLLGVMFVSVIGLSKFHNYRAMKAYSSQKFNSSTITEINATSRSNKASKNDEEKSIRVVVTQKQQKRLLFWASVSVALVLAIISFNQLFIASIVSKMVAVITTLITASFLSILFYELVRISKNKRPAQTLQYFGLSTLPKSYWVVGMIIIVAGTLVISVKSDTSISGLALQNRAMQCAVINDKRDELQRLALSFFPNSISQYKSDPFSLLPLNENVRELLTNDDTSKCANTSVRPEDFPNFATAQGNNYVWKWLTLYFGTGGHDVNSDLSLIAYEGKPGNWFFLGLSWLLLLGVLLILWRKLHSQILWVHLYFDGHFLRHIFKLASDAKQIGEEERNEKLTIIGDNLKLKGIDLDVMLSLTKQNKLPNKLHNFSKLRAVSPFINSLTEVDEVEGHGVETVGEAPYQVSAEQKEITFPNLKISVEQAENGIHRGVDVKLWDVETCLETKALRANLLKLIVEFKSLVLAQRIESFTVYSGFHCLQRVALKDAMTVFDSENARLDSTEYLSWSECLMDFNFKLPDEFLETADLQLLEQEIQCFPELQVTKLMESAKKRQQKCDKPYKESTKVQRYWSTINLILIHAEAFYRFKWELCSNAEKLALYNLAKDRLLNPDNSQMVEHLAMQGLIKVEDEKLILVNQSFAYFVLNAEPPETMVKLERYSEQGIWKNNRVSIFAIVILILISVAYLSGESLLIVFGSIAGVLTTIASITNSANLIRSHMK